MTDLREPLLEPEVEEVGSIFLSLLVKVAHLVLVVLLVTVALLKEGKLAIGNQMLARTVLEATLSLRSVHDRYGVGGLGE